MTGATAFQSLVLGNTTGGNGTYNLSVGTLNANFISVGGGNTGSGSTGQGSFIQSGGSVQLNLVSDGLGHLYVGNAVGTTGSYLLSGGSLDAQNEYIALQGPNGAGRSFVQTGGTNTIHYNPLSTYQTGQLSVGGDQDLVSLSSAGSYTLSGPGSVLNAADERIGVSGTGTFTQNDGVNNITGGVAGTNRTLYVAASPGMPASSAGTYNLNGGTLNAEVEYIGNPGTGTFNHVGGVNAVSTQLLIDDKGTYTQSGGQLLSSGTNASYEGIYVNTQGQFNLNGGVTTANGTGLINTGTFTMSSGGHLNGSGIKLNDVGGVFTATGGDISGSGVLTNSGLMTFTGTNTTTVNSDVQNNAGHKLEVKNVAVVFNGSTVNSGTFKTTASTVVFNGNYTENGTFLSDPSLTIENGNFSVGTTGNLIGSTGDVWQFGRDFTSASTQNTTWNTTLSEMDFFRSNTGPNSGFSLGDHVFAYSGLDLGQTYAGYTDNFAWGLVNVFSGNQLLTSGSGALYTTGLLIGSGTSQIGSFTGNVTIYYDPLDTVHNGYLNGGTYPFGSGTGKVAPVPEPSSLALMGICTLIGTGVIIRRKIRR